MSRELELVEDRVAVADIELSLLRPPEPDALIDERAFEREEFLPYWAELWPSALALARALRRRRLGGARVLELGCGLAVPSLVAAAGGAEVLATDWAVDAVALVPRNAARNGVALGAALADWREPTALVSRGPWQLVVASDVLYERRNVELLLGLLPQLVEPGGDVLLADPRRPAATALLHGAEAEWDVASAVDPTASSVTLHLMRPRAR